MHGFPGERDFQGRHDDENTTARNAHAELIAGAAAQTNDASATARSNSTGPTPNGDIRRTLDATVCLSVTLPSGSDRARLAVALREECGRFEPIPAFGALPEICGAARPLFVP
jgi:hypothetical protein